MECEETILHLESESDDSPAIPEELQGAVLALVEAGKTTPQQIIQVQQSTIERIARLDRSQSTNLLFHISNLLFRQKPTPVSNLLLENGMKLSMGDPVIDVLLGGGLMMNGIIEISGVSGAGKTQFCLQAMIQTVLPVKYGGLGASALFLCTEDVPVTRWRQLIEAYSQRYPDTSDLLNSNLFHEKVYSIDKLTDIIQSRALPLIRTKNVKLLVIDSIAALFRCELGTLDQSQERANVLHSIASMLKLLSDENKLPILVVNQVTDYFGDGAGALLNMGAKGTQNRGGVVPSLGLNWANNINMRIMLSKTELDYYEPAGQEQNNAETPAKKRKLQPTAQPTQQLTRIGVREMSIVFAPHLPQSSCYYIIDQSGIHSLQYS
jgi:DNA-repair protein XRCC3